MTVDNEVPFITIHFSSVCRQRPSLLVYVTYIICQLKFEVSTHLKLTLGIPDISFNIVYNFLLISKKSRILLEKLFRKL